MYIQPLVSLEKYQQEKLLSNTVEAVQVLFESVKARKEKEFIEKIQNEKVKNGKRI